MSDKLGSNFFIVIPTKKFFCLRRFVNAQLCLFELFWHILVRPTTNLYFRQKHLNILQCLWSRMQIRIPISHKASFYSLLIYLPSFAEQFTTNLLLNFFTWVKYFLEVLFLILCWSLEDRCYERGCLVTSCTVGFLQLLSSPIQESAKKKFE